MSVPLEDRVSLARVYGLTTRVLILLQGIVVVRGPVVISHALFDENSEVVVHCLNLVTLGNVVLATPTNLDMSHGNLNTHTSPVMRMSPICFSFYIK